MLYEIAKLRLKKDNSVNLIFKLMKLQQFKEKEQFSQKQNYVHI